ncbi:MAG: hypothetical protein U0790_16585 [Isosphaeraceae bacterium]
MRTTILSLVIASTIGTLSFLAPSVHAQVPAQPGAVYGPEGYVSGEAWRVYPPGSVWQGYAPGTAWRGYAPPAVTAVPPAPAGVIYPPPAFATVPAPVAAGTVYQPATVYTPLVRTVPSQPVRATQRAVAPAYYREFGTGRNVFMHKPWLPNQ